MLEEEKEYILSCLKKAINRDSSVSVILNKRLTGIINRITQGDVYGYILEYSDTDLQGIILTNEIENLEDISRDTLIGLLEIIYNSQE